MSFDARRRLSAILESSEELGAGFRIAMRDLEIRGAGDLLGARQHGNIDTVGFDLYTRLLAQAINEARQKKERFDKAMDARQKAQQESDSQEGEGEEAVQTVTDVESGEVAHVNEGEATTLTHDTEDIQLETAATDSPFDINDPLAPPVTLDLPITAQIPATYIEDDGLRLQIYRRIAGLTSRESVEEMRRELLDRFGEDEETKGVPEEVDNLLYQIQIKILALSAGVQKYWPRARPNCGTQRNAGKSQSHCTATSAAAWPGPFGG